MDTIVIIKARLSNWCDPEDILEGMTLVGITQELLESEGMLDDFDEFEVLAADFTQTQLSLDSALRAIELRKAQGGLS